MRFLQLEWHNHERARNAWDIERAEMKAKIAKQEGEVRSAKKLNDQLNKHIRMLEQALTNERAKGKAGADAHATDDEKKDTKGKKAAMNSMKRRLRYSSGSKAVAQQCLTTHSFGQETQLLPRCRLRTARPIRSRPRWPTREVQTFPHQMRR